MSPGLDKLTSIAESAMTRLRVSSALNGILWLCGLIVPSSLIALPFQTGAIQIAILVLMFLPVAVFCIAFFYFMLKDPNKLRSEDYELRRQALELIQEKGMKTPQLTVAVEAIANPDYRKLTYGDKEEKGR